MIVSRSTLLVSLVAAALAVVTGCGSSDTDGGGGSSASGPGATSTGAGAGSTSSTGSATTASGGSGGAGPGSGGGGSGPVAPIHFIGRWDTTDAAHPSAAWPGSAIQARFSGTGVDLTIDDSGNFFAVVIDDGAPSVLAAMGGSHTYSLASDLADGEHSVWIERRTETFFGTTQFQDLVATGGKPLVETSEPFARMIEIVGDSITCGYGDEGNGPDCGFTPDTENEYLAWGAVAARQLQAEHASIAYSGIGVYQNNGGSMDDTMPIRYERTFADDGGSQWTFAYTPDVVVVDLGTNDFSGGNPGQPYADAMKDFVAQVRGHYANAFIVLAVGTMLGEPDHTTVLDYMNGVISALGDAKVSSVDLGIQDGDADGLGCGYHPSVATQQKMADKLTAHVKSIAGW